MSNSQKPAFLEIMRELNMNPETTPFLVRERQTTVTRADGAGAIMPTTWEL